MYLYDAQGRLAAEYGAWTDSGTSYLTADHLGSTRLVTDASGAVKKCYDYFPFGEDIAVGTGGRSGCFANGIYPSNADTLAEKFTGKERDSETGLDYFGARYFSSAQGRWTSADKPFADQLIRDPQSWNLYAYVRDNPLSHVDSTGTADWGAIAWGVPKCHGLPQKALPEPRRTAGGPRRLASGVQSDTDSFREVLLRRNSDADVFGLGTPGAGENARFVLDPSAGAGAEPCEAERRQRRGR